MLRKATKYTQIKKAQDLHVAEYSPVFSKGEDKEDKDLRTAQPGQATHQDQHQQFYIIEMIKDIFFDNGVLILDREEKWFEKGVNKPIGYSRYGFTSSIFQ